MSIVLLKPKISEKSYNQSDELNTYTFEVPLNSNKHQIKQAVEQQYDVKVKSVKTAVVKGKVKQTTLRRRYPIPGKRSDVKKAYVTLTPGNSLSIFEDL